MRHAGSVWMLALVSTALLGNAADATPHTLTLADGRLRAVVDADAGTLLSLEADHTAGSSYGGNLLAAPAFARTAHGAGTASCGKPDPSAIACDGITYRLGADGGGLRVVADSSKRAVRLAFPQWFMSGVFARGVVQYVGGQGHDFAATSPLRLFYTMDRVRGSVAIVPSGGVFATLASRPGTGTSVTLTRARPRGDVDRWSAPSPAGITGRGRIRFALFGNDGAYPAHLSRRTIVGRDGAADRDAMLIAAYGSAAGVLGSYAAPGSAYPTLAQPTRTYGDAYTFFDPDAWSTVATLSFSGDPLLEKEARGILELAEAHMRPDGQLPHHFETSGPAYLSIARSKQTGPNIFWTLAAIDYVTGSGDEAWLRMHYGAMTKATAWLLGAYDPVRRLVHADGPLFIDVFRRDGFTLDTNMMLVHLLDRMTGVARFVRDDAAARLYTMRGADLRSGLARLATGDHYVTQLNPDGSRRDFVDYDGNYGAVAFGVPASIDAARAVLARLDGGPHTHPGGYGTWVSERRYDKVDCYGDNDGDSDTAMGRIWWLDMRARARTGDHATFDALLARHRALILDRIWMTERIGGDGTPIRAPGYHEYPEILAMVTRELKYGIVLSPDRVDVRPFGNAAFDYAIGGLHVRYGIDTLEIRVPGRSARHAAIAGLTAGRRYRLSTGGVATVAADGVLAFNIRAGETTVATPLPEPSGAKRPA